MGLVDSLRAAIDSLTWKPRRREWIDYYSTCSYDDEAQRAKGAAAAEALTQTGPTVVWDLGANTGRYSRVATERGIMTVGMDADPECVDVMYRDARARGDSRLVPLVMDLCNPTPALGWRNRERMSLADRGPADFAFALALVHHLAIGNNVPLDEIVEFLHGHARRVLVEWIPKDDPMAKRLLRTRKDVFADYNQPAFEAALTRLFHIEQAIPVARSGRTLYRAARRERSGRGSDAAD
jgi:hypothetical protein